ncbi:ATP-binding protein [Maricaulis sp.]|uniref:sensor histidine kinase n=1 Tax=Maricaulis sp. TaxID=1486257 RepID=UPI003A920E62
MQKPKRDIAAWIARRGGPVANLIWIATVAAAAPQLWPILDGPVWLNAAGLLGVAFPAIAGLVLAPRLDRSFERFVLAMLWTGLAAIVAVTAGGVTGTGVLAFLLAPAMAAAGGDREAIVKAGAMSGLAAIIVTALQLTAFVQPQSIAVEYHLPFVLGVVLVVAYGFTCASIRSIRANDAASREAEHGRVRGRAFDAAPAALLACDADGNILAVSEGVRELSPGLPRELNNLPFADLGFEDEDRAELAGAGRRAATRPLSEFLSIRGEKGHAERVRLDARPMAGGSVSVIARDYSAEAENALREAEEARALALEEARAKSQFLASVSHELRTPLNAIIGFSDVMKARLFGPMPARYAEYADLIHESGQHLMELIGDVLDMSKIEADSYDLSRERFDISEVVGLSVKMMRLQAEEAGLSLTVEAGDQPILVNADRKALRQIMLNLLSNAVKFTPQGGAVVVMVRASGSDLVLAVGDSGIGIDPKEAERLGQPYRQASSAREVDTRGTGLGLSLVRALAGLHGGAMTIASAKGVGTTITVTLPVLEQVMGQVDTLHRLDVHQQIERAQEASKSLAATAGAA